MQTLPSLRALPSILAACAALTSSVIPAHAQNIVTVHAEVRNQSVAKHEKSAKGAPDGSDVVVWLNPLDRSVAAVPDANNRKRPQLVQRDKSFHPHVLVVRVGSVVDFPNRDPFFHNVFSLFDGKRFDLGLYEAGATNSVRFDRLGVSFLFCNIHPEMSAVVVAVDTPYFGISDRAGNISIPDVPDGKYELRVWYERSLPDDLKNLARTITISASAKDLGTVSVPENPGFSSAHKNKYGQDYTPPSTPAYSKP